MPPRIPIIEQTTSAPLSGPSPRASAPRGDNAFGEALGDLAKDVGNFSDSMRWQDEQDAKVWTAGALSKAHLDLQEEFQKAQETAGEAAHGFTPAVLSRFDKYADDAVKNAPDDTARAFLSERLTALRTSFGTQAINFEANARQGWRMGKIGEAIDNTAKSIQDNPTPENFKTLYAEQRAALDALEIEPDKKRAVGDKLKETALSAYWLGRIRQDPVGAQDALRGGIASPTAGAFTAPARSEAVEKYAATIDAKATQFGIDANFMRAQLAAESSGDPQAVNRTARNGQPSIGIAQFQPETAKQYGIDPTVPEQAIQGQAAYMADLLKQFGGDYRKAAAAYNWGQGNVQKAVDERGDNWMDVAPRETKAYVGRIFDDLGQSKQFLVGQIKPEHVAPSGDSIIDATPFKLRVAMLQHAESEANKQQSLGRASLRQELRDAETSLLTTGAYPNMAALGRDRFIASLGPDEGQRTYEAFQDTAKTGAAIQAFKTMPASAIAANIQASAPRSGGVVTPEAEANHRRLQEAGSRVLEARQKDPILFGAQNGLLPQEPLSTDPAKLTPQLATRTAIAQTMAKDYGTPLAVFSNSEAEALNKNLVRMTPDQQVGLFKAIRDGVRDDDAYGAAMRQVRPDSPVTMLAGNMIGLDAAMTTREKWFGPDETVTATDAARLMLRGEALLNPTKEGRATDGNVKPMPMPKDDPATSGFRNTFNAYAGQAFTASPMAADAFYQASRAVYAALSADAGDYSGVMDAARATAAIKTAVGTVAEHNGKKVIAPYGMKDSEFLDRAKSRIDDAVTQNGLDARFANFGNVTLTVAGKPGRYYAQVGAGYLIGRDNNPIVIDVTKTPVPSNAPTVPISRE